MGTTWEHAQLEIQKFLKIRITLLSHLGFLEVQILVLPDPAEVYYILYPPVIPSTLTCKSCLKKSYGFQTCTLISTPETLLTTCWYIPVSSAGRQGARRQLLRWQLVATSEPSTVAPSWKPYPLLCQYQQCPTLATVKLLCSILFSTSTQLCLALYPALLLFFCDQSL